MGLFNWNKNSKWDDWYGDGQSGFQWAAGDYSTQVNPTIGVSPSQANTHLSQMSPTQAASVGKYYTDQGLYDNMQGNKMFGFDTPSMSTLGTFGKLYSGYQDAKAAKEQNRINKERLAFDKASGIKSFDANVEQYNNSTRGLNDLRSSIHAKRQAAGDTGLGNLPRQDELLKKWGES